MSSAAAAAERELSIPRALYPFDGHYLDLDGLRYHYLDEGEGEPALLVHGNPTWSFYYRELVHALRPGRRVIVPDHIGCGLSDKPGDERYEYTLARRADDLERLVDHLEPERKITLIAHDWGGMIAMTWAVRHPDRVARIVLMNTAAFHMPADKSFPWQLWLARTPLGTLLVRGFNAFARGATRAAARRRMPADVRDAYCAPYDSWENRIATLRFVQDIPLRPGDRAWEVVARVQDGLAQFASVPTLIGWGEKDFVFDEPFLAEWQRRWPHAEVERYPDAGHYVLEDASESLVPRIVRFLDDHPIAPAAS